MFADAVCFHAEACCCSGIQRSCQSTEMSIAVEQSCCAVRARGSLAGRQGRLMVKTKALTVGAKFKSLGLFPRFRRPHSRKLPVPEHLPDLKHG